MFLSYLWKISKIVAREIEIFEGEIFRENSLECVGVDERESSVVLNVEIREFGQSSKGPSIDLGQLGHVVETQ